MSEYSTLELAIAENTMLAESVSRLQDQIHQLIRELTTYRRRIATLEAALGEAKLAEVDAALRSICNASVTDESQSLQNKAPQTGRINDA